jgi:hypothetical protein
MKHGRSMVVVVAAFGSFGIAPGAPNAGPAHAHKACRAGFVQAVVSGRRVCRPAPDLRVSVAVTPEANRVGGTFSYEVVVGNSGRKAAPRVTLSANATADAVSSSTSSGTCPAAEGPLSISCGLGTIQRGAAATVTIVVRATALGSLRLSIRASSPTRDARPKDNATSKVTQVREPDSVKGTGVRPTFGGGVRPPVTNEIDAISGPTGADPAGTFRVKYPSFELRGRVVCLTVAGNRASVGGIVEQSNEAMYPPGHAIQLTFTDKGDPGVGNDTQSTYPGVESASPCPVPLFSPEQPELALIEGNYVVRDVQP